MVVNSLLTINGSEVFDTYSYHIGKSIDEDNTASSYELVLDNFQGANSNKYNMCDDLVVYADIDVNPPTTKIFNGIVEDIRYEGEPMNERVTITGRDYMARLMDRTVQPEVYTNWEIGSIVRDIVNKYVKQVTPGSVQTTPTVLPRITFNHTPVYDAVKQLADLSNYIFYVDNDKILHFEPPSTTSSGYTFDSGNVLSANFEERRDTVYNQIWVYGDRYLDGYKETFGAIAGSIYTLKYKPSNTEVTVNGNIIQPGAVQNMSTTAGSGVRYLVNYDNMQIVFVSGTNNGDNIPTTGSSIIINYKRSLPIVKVGDNEISKARYCIRNKVINDKNIKDPQTAMNILQTEMANNGVAKKEGNLTIKGILNVQPGQTCNVNLPFHGINNQTYDIIEASYDFSKENNLSEEILNVKVNKKLNDITDYTKQLAIDLKKLQAADISNTDILTRFQYTNGSLSIRTSGTTVYSRPINDSFVVGHPINGFLGVVRPDTIGSIISGATFATGCGIGYNQALAGSRAYVFVKDANDVCNIGSKDTYSISFWFAGSNIGSAAGYSISEHWEGTNYPWSFRIEAGSTINARIYDGATSNSISNISGLWVNGSYHHYVFKRNFGTDIGSYTALYIDNTFIGSVQDTTNGNVKSTSTGFCFLTRSAADGQAKAINGSLDDFRVYNKLLSSYEIGSLYSKVNYPTDHLLAYYKFDEGVGSFVYNSASVEMPTSDALMYYNFNTSGTTVTDNTGSYLGSTVSLKWSNGVYGNGSAMFISGYSYLNLYNGYDNLKFNSGNSFSLCAWVNLSGGNLSGLAGTAGIIGKGIQGVCNYSLCMNSGTTPYVAFGERSGTVVIAEIDATNSKLNFGEWKHAVGVYDASSYTNYLYINGSLQVSESTGGSVFNNTGSFVIGVHSTFGGNLGSSLMYSIDEARVYNRALSANEVYNLYAGKTIQPLLGDRRGGSTILFSGGYY